MQGQAICSSGRNCFRLWLCLLLWANLGALRAQRMQTELQFGTNITHPYIKGNFDGNAHVRMNYFVGLNSRKAAGENWVNLGLFWNAVNYELRSNDSPQVTFITMAYIGLPMQLEIPLKKDGFFILTGVEPKLMVKGHENTAQPIVSKLIGFGEGNSGYPQANFAFRGGISYRSGVFGYYLLGNADMFPFRDVGGARFYDIKLQFGFTMMPLGKKR